MEDVRLRLILTLLVLGLSTPAVAVDRAESIDDVIDRLRPASWVPGVAYAIVADGDISELGGRGVIEKGSSAKITADTPLLIGSVSKSFTALAVMQLAEAGRVELDAALSNYLDVFMDRPAGSITIRQLLSHTSGFSTRQGNPSPIDDNADADALAHRVTHLQQVTPDHAPGSRWEYSNLNYQILGRLIEVVSARSYQDYVASNILRPLGMTHSFVSDGELHPSMATGHRPWWFGKRPLTHRQTSRGTAPQGGVVASAHDLARYMSIMMNGQSDVLSAAGKETMMQPANEVSPFYGLGWFVDEEGGSVWHSGLSPGFESLATMMPEQRKAVVVLVNANGGLGFGESAALLNGITGRALGLDYEGEGSRWSQKALFLGMTLLPVAFLLSIVWAWFHRDAIRAKSGLFGTFSLWFPLLTTLGMAWVFFGLMPILYGASFGTIRLYQPDLGLTMIASALTGVAWAVFRLSVAYSGRRPPQD